jgi:Na+/H+ antiporter NhaC
MKNRFALIGLMLSLLPFFAWSQAADTAKVAPDSLLPIIPGEYELNASDGRLIFMAADAEGNATVVINGENQVLNFRGGQAVHPTGADERGELLLIRAGENFRLYHVARVDDDGYRVRRIPLWLSILPPLVAILLALIFREVVISLFVGVWVGAFVAGGLRVESLYYFAMSFLQVVEKYIVSALNDSGHLAVIVFSLLIGGMVAVISRNGGMAGVVASLSRYARSPRSAQFVTWLLGVAIFFDDYANTLIVGNTMRSVTDRHRVSREKLAYIVDSTAAPVAAIAFITTWIGAELGYIDDGVESLRAFNFDMTPYAIFLQSLKYSFYPILTLIFILLLIYLRRDYGPMYPAELRARRTGEITSSLSSRGGGGELDELNPVEGAPIRWYNAFIPVLVVIGMTIFGLIDTGFAGTYNALAEAGVTLADQSWGEIWRNLDVLLTGEEPSFLLRVGLLIGNADSYVALLWASLSGVLAALVLTLGGGTDYP